MDSSAWPNLPTPKPTRSGLLAVNGVELYYELHGSEEAPPLLFLLGITDECGAHMAKSVINALKSRFYLLIFDHRGTGRSTLDTTPSHYSMRQFAKDAAALVGKVGWKTCHVFGHSFGGCVAQEVALLSPRILKDRTLVVACAPAGGGGIPTSIDLDLYRTTFRAVMAVDSRNACCSNVRRRRCT